MDVFREINSWEDRKPTGHGMLVDVVSTQHGRVKKMVRKCRAPRSPMGFVRPEPIRMEWFRSWSLERGALPPVCGQAQAPGQVGGKSARLGPSVLVSSHRHGHGADHSRCLP